MNGTVAIAVITFLAMEGVTYAAHRWVMHGIGWVLHHSHHRMTYRTRPSRFEANDLFPVMFSGVAIMLLAAAFRWPDIWSVYWGVLAYGAAYLFVHEIYIHRRLPLPDRLFRFLAPLRRAHRVHHLYGGEPFGMLMPLVPEGLRERAARTDRDPLVRAR